jgi:2-oxoglutarate dehydrogenase E1 component
VNLQTKDHAVAISEALNADFIDSQYRLWKQEPSSVSSDWQSFFQGFDMARGTAAPSAAPEQALAQTRVEKLKRRYRDLGHLLACMDPLAACPTEHPLLSLDAFGLSLDDLGQEFYSRRFAGGGKAPLKEIIAALRETYCRSIGVEYMHLQDPDERRWLQDRMEQTRNRPDIDAPGRRRILEKLTQAHLFEQFLNKKFVAVTRFSLEGADGAIPLLDTLVSRVAGSGVREIVLGMAHRGRLNVQAHILDKPYSDIFGEFESCYDPGQLVGSGDVKYHNGYLTDQTTPAGDPIRIYLVSNPSHLEAVDPVAQGLARARQDRMGSGAQGQVMPLLIHGDAAFAGQGVVAEILNMSQLAGYRSGGTVHLIINNQIGYTTLPEDARSTRYATDVAKMVMAPIFHVHGENPEALVHVARLAADYRMAFGKDVVIDLVCYRRYGHNEGDEPYFTQPLMVERIRQRPALAKLYADRLIEDKVVTEAEVSAMGEAVNQRLQEDFDAIHGSACPFPESKYFENWDGYHGRHSHDPVDTGVAEETLRDLSARLHRVPDGFSINRKLKGLLQRRQDAVDRGNGLDWANAEALAFASLVTEGSPIRLSGQDSGRGTFSHRHSVWLDVKTGAEHVPLNHLDRSQAPYEVFNSLLAEYGVLGFEYGYALARPESLVMWEAQFGDFANNAQTVFDLFIASGQSKWQRLNGLVMLLPHGWEGLGPEHSSARMERYLQLCAENNLQVANPTTPAQYFHLLRRQVRQRLRLPLVVMTPKSLLRHPLAVSAMGDLANGHYETVLDDPDTAGNVKRVLICSGKIYYELLQRKQQLKARNTAIIRIEQYYPFPEERLKKVISAYKKAETWCWVQEEPENMGAWWFIRPRLEKALGKPVAYVGRKPASSPATGFPKIYRAQQAAITDEAVGPEKSSEEQGMSG